MNKQIADNNKTEVKAPTRRRFKVFGLGGLIGIIIIFILFFAVYRILNPLKCNGYKELCDRPINEIAFATTHNSMSYSDNNWLWPSHDGDIPTQLNYGIRAFLIDTHYFDAVSSISSYFPEASELELSILQAFVDKIGLKSMPGTFLCHMICNIGYTTLSDTLTDVRKFLDENPNEVLVFIIEDKISPTDTEKAFKEAGLDKYVYTHTEGKEWPTLRKMIWDNTRLVVMAEVEGPPPAWYQNAWNYTEETPYAFEDVEALGSVDSCSPNRGGTGKDFFLLNNWTERVVPSREDAKTVNSYEFLLDRAQKCEKIRDKMPNFVAVNFFKEGNVLGVVNKLNGVGE